MFSSAASRISAKWMTLFTLANVVLVQIVAVLYVYLSGVYPSNFYAWLFVLTYWCGHLFFLSALASVIFIPLFFLLKRGVWARRTLAFLAACILVYMTVDTFVFAQYRFHINFIVLDLFFNGHGQVISLTTKDWIVIVLLVSSVGGLEIFLDRAIWKYQDRVRSVKPILLFYLGCLIASQVGHAWADAIYYTPVTRLNNLLPLSVPLRTKSLFAKYGLIDQEELKRRKALRHDITENDLKYPLEPVHCRENVKPMSFLWLVVDSLRSDMLNPVTMPYATEFSKSATVFENHFSNSNSTRYGIFSLFYGIPGSYFEAALKNRVPSMLISELAKRDYNFGIFANAPLTKPEFDETVFLPVKNLRKFSKSATVDGRDIEITDDMVNFLKAQDKSKPFFGFMFFDAPHGYAYPKDLKVPFKTSGGFSYMSLNANSDPTPMRSVYSNAVYFDDVEINKVLTTLKNKGLLDSTVVLITGDHGQEINDNKKGYWGHNSSYSLYQTHVPLVVYWPGKAPQRISERTTHLDVSTTMMTDALGCEKPQNYSSGANLFDRKGREWFVMGREGDYAIRAGDITTVVYPTGDYDIVDDTYTPIPGAKLDSRIFGEALKEMRRFTK